MYALRTHPDVAEHLSKTVCRELKYSTLRVLHIFLEYHLLLLLKAIRDGRAHGIGTPDAMLAATSSIQNLGNRCRSEIREANQADAPNEREAGKREKPSTESGIEADVTMLEQCVDSGLTGDLCEGAYRRINS
jgi:hypothetical protein